MADAAVAAPADKKAPPKFKQRTARTFKSKAPKPGQKGWEGIKSCWQWKYICTFNQPQPFFAFSAILHIKCCTFHSTLLPDSYFLDAKKKRYIKLFFHRTFHPFSASATTSLAWRDLAQISQWFAHGRHLATWSSVTWRNMELSRNLPISSAQPSSIPAMISLRPHLLTCPASIHLSYVVVLGPTYVLGKNCTKLSQSVAILEFKMLYTIIIYLYTLHWGEPQNSFYTCPEHVPRQWTKYVKTCFYSTWPLLCPAF